MTRKKVLAFILVLLAFVVCFAILNRDRIFEKKQTAPYEISVITRGKNSESWTTIKQGIDQAAKDLNCEVSFVSLSKQNNTAEQIALMQREMENGAQAIVISPVNSKDLEQPIARVCQRIPVIAVESTVDTMKDLPYISSDNFQLGSALAHKMLLNNSSRRKIAILRNSLDCSNIHQRYLGIITALNATKNRIEYWDIPDDPQEAYDTAKGMLQNSSASTLIALDGSTLESVGKAERDLLKTGSKQVEIYGIGRTNMVVSMLEDNIISAIGVENEFNLGYLSVQSAVNHIAGAKDGSMKINYAIVEEKNMYNSDNQRLLFPFVR